MKNYTFDIDKMIRWLIPFFLFQPVHYAWLQTLLVSVKSNYVDFMAFRAQMLADATINSQVNRLTKALWDKFDNTQTIYLQQNAGVFEQTFIYLESEGATIQYDYIESEGHTPEEFDYLDSEYTADVNFVVWIPAAIGDNQAAIYAFVKRYIFSGITFSIQIIS
jgi:hypothetical protein